MFKSTTDAPNAPQAIGPYSQALEAGNMIFLSGQIPLDPSTGELTQGIENQTTQVLKNIKAVLTHLGLSFSNVVKTTIFLTDLGHFQKVNEHYQKAFGDHRPARSTVQVAALPRAAQIEIEVIAMR